MVENRRGMGAPNFHEKRARLDPDDSGDEIKRDKKIPVEDTGGRKGAEAHGRQR